VAIHPVPDKGSSDYDPRAVGRKPTTRAETLEETPKKPPGDKKWAKKD
jgi:hypothetical protein